MIKKINLLSLFLPVMLLFAASSCQKNIITGDNLSQHRITFTAIGDVPVTKGTLQEESEKAYYLWFQSDKIDLSDGTGKVVADINDEDHLKMVAGFNTMDVSDIDPSAMAFASYPHHIDTDALHVKYFKNVEDYHSGSLFAPMIGIIPAPTFNGTVWNYGLVNFKHLGGLIKLELTNMPEGVTSVVFRALNGTPINGFAKVRMPLTEEMLLDGTWQENGWYASPDVAAVDPSVQAFTTYNLTTATVLGDSWTIYVPIPAGTTFSEEGFQVELLKDGTLVDSMSFPFSSPFTIQRAQLLSGVVFDFNNRPVTVNLTLGVTDAATDPLSEYRPTKVMIYKESDGMKAMSTLFTTLTESEKFKDASQQTFSFKGIKPGDYSNQEFWLVVELEHGGGHKYWIPMKRQAGGITSGGTLDISIPNLNTGMNDSDWYVTEDTRVMPAAVYAYAYGEANTFFIQCKPDSKTTYHGASYQANSEIPDEVVIDYRLRGDYFNAEKPENVTFDWFRLMNDKMYAPRQTDYDDAYVVVNESTFTFAHEPEQYRVRVKNVRAYAGAPILVMRNSEGKILWGWSFWNIAADGTQITPVTVGSYQFAPMDIGQPTTQGEKWVANGNTTTTSYPDPIYRMTHLYQWGRSLPIFWTPYWSLDGDKMWGNNGNVPAYPGPSYFGESLDNPVGFIINKSATTIDDIDWCNGLYYRLWGSDASESEGKKSIYDPCPKGWKVPTKGALDALKTMTYIYDTAAADGNHHIDVTSGTENLVLWTSGHLVARLASSDGQRPKNEGLGVNGLTTVGGFWGNSRVGDTGTVRAFLFDSAGTFTHENAQNASSARPVRCIVDTENR